MAGNVGAINFKEINFDTQDRSGGTVQAPVFAISATNRIKQIQIVEVDIPFTWYIFDNTNNFIDFVEPMNGPETFILIPPGNYTIDEMITLLTDLLNTASPNGYTYEVAVNVNSYKITISSTGIFNLLWATGAHSTTNPYKQLGFNLVNLVGNTAYTGQNLYNMSGDNYIYVKCNQVLGFDNAITNSNTAIDSKIVSRVPVNCNSGETIAYRPAAPITTQLLFNDNNNFTVTLEFSLTGRNNKPLDLNGHNWSFILGIFT